MQRFITRLTPTTKHAAGFHTSVSRAAITKFKMPAMSPTMTEGTIHEWKVKEGMRESFSAGDVLLELETDKAQIDVEAPEDGVLAKIMLKNGEKAPVNTPIALLAEEGDDISNLEIPADEPATEAKASEPQQQQQQQPSEQPKTAPTPSTPMSHHDIDTSKLKKPLSPAVLNLVLRYHIKDLDAIKASGPGGRILKGDVLAHLGFIPYKPAPPPKTSAAPPRDQIVFAKPAAKAAPVKEEKPVLPNFISRNVVVDELFALRRTLNEQNRSSVSVNDFIAKAASRALQDIVNKQKTTAKSTSVVYKTDAAAFSESYKGGSFKIFDLAPPTYDFITDSYEPSKPYQLSVSPSKPVSTAGKPSRSADDEMLDLIGFLGGEQPRKEQQPRAVKLTTDDGKLSFSESKKGPQYQVELKLADDAPGKILNDPKATLFLDRVEYYVRNPTELVG